MRKEDKLIHITGLLKVFCSKCQWYERGNSYNSCDHPNNLKQVLRGEDYKSPGKIQAEHIEDARIINKENDCKNFCKRQWWQFRWRL